MGSHRYYQHAEIPHPHPGPPLEGEGDFAWLNNVANQDNFSPWPVQMLGT